MKENNVKVALDIIDKEIMEIAFELVPYNDTEVRVIEHAEITLQGFEDCLIRCLAMKGNHYAAHQ